jgi:hypothetical protein
MSVGRPWVRRLALLLAAGLVVQVPGLVGVGVSGASAAAPTPSYSVQLSIDPNTCVATVTATWSGAKVNSIDLTVTDLTNTSTPANAQESVSGHSGTVSYPFPLNPLPAGTVTNSVDPHYFNAAASFNSAQNLTAGATTNYTVEAPCYLGTLGVV